MAQVRSVAEVYKSVVNDVIDGVREAFLDEGLDDQILQELKQIWESKLKQSKALEGSSIADTSRVAPPPAHSHHQAKIFQQHLLLNNAASNNTTISANQLQSLQATPVLNLGAQQLSQSAQTATQSLPQTVLQHLNNISYLVPRGSAHRPILIQPQLAGTSFIQQGSVIFGLSDQPIATSATPQNSVALDTTGRNIVQLDGLVDSSSDEEDNEDEVKQKEENEDAGEGGEEVEDDPLNSDDDTSDNDAQDLFDVDNVVVCQFDKINRSKAKWKFHLKDGIMNLNGRDHIFQKATGDAEF